MDCSLKDMDANGGYLSLTFEDCVDIEYKVISLQQESLHFQVKCAELQQQLHNMMGAMAKMQDRVKQLELEKDELEQMCSLGKEMESMHVAIEAKLREELDIANDRIEAIQAKSKLDMEEIVKLYSKEHQIHLKGKGDKAKEKIVISLRSETDEAVLHQQQIERDQLSYSREIEYLKDCNSIFKNMLELQGVATSTIEVIEHHSFMIHLKSYLTNLIQPPFLKLGIDEISRRETGKLVEETLEHVKYFLQLSSSDVDEATIASFDSDFRRYVHEVMSIVASQPPGNGSIESLLYELHIKTKELYQRITKRFPEIHSQCKSSELFIHSIQDLGATVMICNGHNGKNDNKLRSKQFKRISLAIQSCMMEPPSKTKSTQHNENNFNGMNAVNNESHMKEIMQKNEEMRQRLEKITKETRIKDKYNQIKILELQEQVEQLKKSVQ